MNAAENLDQLLLPYAPRWMRGGYAFVVVLALFCLGMAIFVSDSRGTQTYNLRAFFGVCATLLMTFCYFKFRETYDVLLDRDGKLYSRIDMIGRRNIQDMGAICEVWLFPGRNERQEKVYKIKLASEGDSDFVVSEDAKRELALAKAKQVAVYLGLPLRDESLDGCQVYQAEELDKTHQQRLQAGDQPEVTAEPTTDCVLVSALGHELEISLPSAPFQATPYPFFSGLIIFVLSRLLGSLGGPIRVLLFAALALYLVRCFVDTKFLRTLAVKEGAVFLIQPRPYFPSSVSILLSDLDEVGLRGSALHFVHGLECEVLEFHHAQDAAWTKQQLDAFLYSI